MKKIYQTILILLLSLYGVSACSASEKHWLTILGTFTSPSQAVNAIKKLSKQNTKVSLISSNDCNNIKPNLIIAIEGTFTKKATAQEKANNWKAKGVKDAYIKTCKVKPNSKLALNIPFISPSFQQLDFDPINWNMKEVLSSIKVLDKNQVIAIKPYYMKDPEDIREGLRTKIELKWINNKKSVVLSKDCIDFNFFKDPEFLGFSCVKEIAAMNSLHQVNIFTRTDGKIVKSIKRCRSAKIVNRQLQCLKETVDINGELQLMKTTISLQ